MTLNANEERVLAIICREVLDILDLPDETSMTKCLDIRDLINSWVTANNLPIHKVERQGGAYLIGIEKEKKNEVKND